MTATKICPFCSSISVEHHCDEKNKNCTWWRCKDCNSFGDNNSERAVDARR